MFEVILLIIGAVVGFCLYKKIIMSSSRQETVNNKKNTFDAITESWTEIRHFILANHKGKLLSKEANNAIDEMHKNSKQLISSLDSACENPLLVADIRDFNESIYRNEWDTLDLKKLTAVTDQLKADSSALAKRMGDEVNSSYRLEWQDVKSCAMGLCSTFTSSFTSAGDSSSGQSSNNSPKTASSANTATAGTAEYKEDWIEKLLKSKFSFLKDWDIRSLSRRSGTTESPEENKSDEDPSPAPESKPKKTPSSATANRKPQRTESAAETKPKKAEPSTESKPKKVIESAMENKAKKEKISENKPK